MKRWVVVDWENKSVLEEAFLTQREAWRASCEHARKDNRSPDDLDMFEIEVEAL